MWTCLTWIDAELQWYQVNITPTTIPKFNSGYHFLFFRKFDLVNANHLLMMSLSEKTRLRVSFPRPRCFMETRRQKWGQNSWFLEGHHQSTQGLLEFVGLEIFGHTGGWQLFVQTASDSQIDYSDYGSLPYHHKWFQYNFFPRCCTWRHSCKRRLKVGKGTSKDKHKSIHGMEVVGRHHLPQTGCLGAYLCVNLVLGGWMTTPRSEMDRKSTFCFFSPGSEWLRSTWAPKICRRQCKSSLVVSGSAEWYW